MGFDFNVIAIHPLFVTSHDHFEQMILVISGKIIYTQDYANMICAKANRFVKVVKNMSMTKKMANQLIPIKNLAMVVAIIISQRLEELA